MLNSESFILDTLVPIVAMSDNVKGLSVMLGLGSLAGGVFSLLSHKNHLDQVIESAPAERKLAYESRKYRRRAAASSLIASQANHRHPRLDHSVDVGWRLGRRHV